MPIQFPIYLDNHSTTPLDPAVLEAMMPYLTQDFGNPASRTHSFGWRAEEAVEIAREQVAKLIDADPKEILWTSGTTESINLALKGIAETYSEKGNHIITQKTEHKAVLDTCKKLEMKGFRITYLPVDPNGQIDTDQLKKSITDQTILVSIMFANNEVGTIQPIPEIGKICHDRGVFFHTDAAQACGKIPVQVEKMNIDLMSMSAHKIYGPKGTGALFIRKRNPRVKLIPQMNGGGQENGLRSGTLNVPAIVGMGKAFEIPGKLMKEESHRISSLRDKLYTRLKSELDEIYLNGHPTERLPNNLNLSFAHTKGEAILMAMKNVALSSGSACTSATSEPSYVLKALGLSDESAHASIRFGLGRFNTEEEIDYVAERTIESVRKLRENSINN